LLWDSEPRGDSTGIDYWLRRWIAAYSFLLNQPEAVRRQQIFVDYDRLCAAPEAGARDLAIRLALGCPLNARALRPAVRRAGRRASRTIVSEAYTLYGDLLERGRGIGEQRQRALG
jgi:hypothetical protein